MHIVAALPGARVRVAREQLFQFVEKIALRAEVGHGTARSPGGLHFSIHVLTAVTMVTVTLNDGWTDSFATEDLLECHLDIGGTGT